MSLRVIYLLLVLVALPLPWLAEQLKTEPLPAVANACAEPADELDANLCREMSLNRRNQRAR